MFLPLGFRGDSCQEVTSERNTAVEHLTLGKWQSSWGPVLAWAKWEVSCIFRDSVEKGGAQRGGQLRDGRGSFARTGRKNAEMLLELKTKPKILKDESRSFEFCHTGLYMGMCADMSVGGWALLTEATTAT